MEQYYKAIDLCNAIKQTCGIDRYNEFKNHNTDVLPLYMYDYYFMNEFYTRDEVLWWETCSKIIGINPGETIYLTF